MLSRAIRACYLFLLASSLLLPAGHPQEVPLHLGDVGAPLAGGKSGGLPSLDFPAVDPNYIYNQLFYMVTHFQQREAGYNNDVPPYDKGHDKFATYWAQEMVRDLQGFGPQVRQDKFAIKGWRNRPADVPAFNVEVTVPGVAHSQQVVVIGCHYDGEASSTQSANDDGSGCAIELGVAKAMGIYWRRHHTYPARTLRFVIFDAEEQGLLGSFHYVNETVNGDLHNIVAMFNEEQNGIAYPLRYLGELSNPLLPFYIDMSPLQNSRLYPHQSNLSARQRANITQFRTLMQQAIPAAFSQFQALGYQALTYHAGNNQDVPQPIFTSDDLSYIHAENDTLGGSDQIPFTLAGIPCATFAGNSTYYDPNPPPWSYPYDQPQDTIQLMNTFADGSSQQSQALTLALALPGMLTTWMLHAPAILGEAASDGSPIAAISDIGRVQVGLPLSLDAKASFDPKKPANGLIYSWNFGDGIGAQGQEVTHTYKGKGTYTLALSVASADGRSRSSKIINVSTQTALYNNPYAHYQPSGYPRPNPKVQLPTPDDSLTDRVSTISAAKGPATTTTKPSVLVPLTRVPLMTWIYIVGILLLVGVVVLVMRRRRHV